MDILRSITHDRVGERRDQKNHGEFREPFCASQSGIELTLMDAQIVACIHDSIWVEAYSAKRARGPRDHGDGHDHGDESVGFTGRGL